MCPVFISWPCLMLCEVCRGPNSLWDPDFELQSAVRLQHVCLWEEYAGLQERVPGSYFPSSSLPCLRYPAVFSRLADSHYSPTQPQLRRAGPPGRLPEEKPQRTTDLQLLKRFWLRLEDRWLALPEKDCRQTQGHHAHVKTGSTGRSSLTSWLFQTKKAFFSYRT